MQYRKAPFGIDVSQAGRLTFVRETQSRNTSSPRIVALAGKTIDCSDKFPSNAPSPIFLIPGAIEIDCNEVHQRNVRYREQHRDDARQRSKRWRQENPSLTQRQNEKKREERLRPAMHKLQPLGFLLGSADLIGIHFVHFRACSTAFLRVTGGRLS